LTDYCDGLLSSHHPILSVAINCLSLHFYTDEFEVCNPLGSRKTVHKIVAFYFFLGDVHPKYRSQLCHIYLAILVKNSFLSSGLVIWFACSAVL